ncbi:MAG TPA: hypothetical protein VF789_24485 [Thermoanaerobaculia bacterium]
MTIAVAWVRRLENGAEELIFCSDSRLSGGKRFDHCQKVFRFARTDAAICFAGSTDWAYPMIIAAIKAADLHLPSETRSLGLAKFKSHVTNILNQMQREVHNFVLGENIPDVTFLLGGYDWWGKRFRLWRLQFDKGKKKFIAHERTGSNKFGSLGKIEIAGDPEWSDVMRSGLRALAQQRYGKDMRQPRAARFNMEPFEIIRDMLKKCTASDSIGGAPQAVKVYQYLNSTDVGIFWPQVDGGRLFLSGRPLLDYERATINSVLDTESVISTWSSGGVLEAATQIRRAIASDMERVAEEDPADPEIPE